METRGTVSRIELSRSVGKVSVRNQILVLAPLGPAEVELPGQPPQVGVGLQTKTLDHYFFLYDDGTATMIDPTEMVKRNWLIGLLQRAAGTDMEVTIVHPEVDPKVLGVVLHAALG